MYKEHHRRKSKGVGMLCHKFHIAGHTEDGEAIFEIGEATMVYRSEPHIQRAEKELERFKKFLDEVQKLPPYEVMTRPFTI